MKAVLDSSVLVAALRSKNGASNEILRLAWTHQIEILASPALFLEYEEVIGRDEHAAIHGLSTATTAAFLGKLAAIIKPVKIHYRLRPQLPDPDDEMVLETAINGYAHAIVTHNVRDFRRVPSRFNLRILKPSEALKEIRK